MREVEKNKLKAEVKKLKKEGFTYLGVISCADNNNLELFYNLRNLEKNKEEIA